MLQSSFTRQLLIALVLLGSGSALARCADRSGTFDADCQTEYLHLPTARDAEGKQQELVLIHRHAFPYIPLSAMGWNIAEAKLYSKDGSKCEPLPPAKVRFESDTRKHRLSGAFIADFPDGKHEEGKFVVKYRHQGPKVECL
jgi:hypothetical protein